MLIILVAEIAAGVWAFQNKDELNKMVQASVKHTVKEEYGVIDSRTIAFDAIQKHVRKLFNLLVFMEQIVDKGTCKKNVKESDIFSRFLSTEHLMYF